MDPSRFGGRFRGSFRGGFERLGMVSAKVGVVAGSVVEVLNIIEIIAEIGPDEIQGFAEAFSDALLLQAGEECLVHFFEPSRPRVQRMCGREAHQGLPRQAHEISPWWSFRLQAENEPRNGQIV